MADTTNKTKIMEKLASLLERTEERGASKAEAENAAKIAARMLLEHGLSVEDIDLHKYASEIADESVMTEYRNPANWLRILMREVADAFDCRIVIAYEFDKTGKWGTYQKAVAHFIGQEEDAAVAKYFFGYLMRRLYELSGIEADKHPVLTRQHRTNYRDSFIVGAAHELGKRLRDERWEGLNREQVAKAGELIRLKKEAANEYVEDRFGKLKKVAPKDTVIAHAYHAGKEVAKDLPLTKGMPGQEDGLKKLT